MNLLSKLSGVYGHFGIPSLYWYALDVPRAKKSVEKMMSWDFAGVHMAHGSIVPPSIGTSIIKDKYKYEWESMLM